MLFMLDRSFKDKTVINSKNVQIDILDVPETFSNFELLFSTTACSVIRILKEICYTMANLDLHIWFIPVAAHIDFL